MAKKKLAAFAAGSLRFLTISVGSVTLTATFFLVLPLIQAIGKKPENDLTLYAIDAGVVPPPPPPPEEEPEEQEEEGGTGAPQARKRPSPSRSQ